jgi:mycoredoxin
LGIDIDCALLGVLAQVSAQPRRGGPVLTVYSTTWCGYCVRLKKQLDREGISYTSVDIEQDPAAEEIVKTVNNGNATVPTVAFPDGTTMTNPSIREVTEKLASAA